MQHTTDMGFAQKTENDIVFCNDKILLKVKKNSILAPFGDLFTNFRAKWNLYGTSVSVTFFLFLGFYCCPEFQKKQINRFQEKLVTDVQMEIHADARTSMNSWDLPCRGSNKNQSIQSYEKQQNSF